MYFGKTFARPRVAMEGASFLGTTCMTADRNVMEDAGEANQTFLQDVSRLVVRTLLGSGYRALGDCSLGKSIVLFLKLSVLRMILLTQLIVAAVALPAAHLFGATIGEIRLVTIPISALFEDQSRWIFARCHERKLRSQIIFFLLIASLETIGYYLNGKGLNIEHYLFERIPATLFHMFACAAVVLYYQIGSKSRWKWAIPLAVVALHAAMDLNAFNWASRWATFAL